MARYVDIEPYEDCRIILNKEDVGFPCRDLPTADVEKVRHGEWEEVTTNAIDGLAFDTVASMRCSKCGRYHNRVYHYGDPTEMEHYCSFCGVAMRTKDGRDILTGAKMGGGKE